MLSCLTTNETMTRVWELGLRPDVFETPVNQAVFDFILTYWYGEQMQRVPTRDILTYEFPGVSFENTVEESVPYLVEVLQRRYATNRLQEMIREAAGTSSDDPQGTLKGLFSAAYAASETIVPRFARSNMATSVEQRRMRYLNRQENQGSGITLGFPTLDHHTNGLRPGELCAVGAFSKVGKAQPLSAPIATPTGWTTMGKLSVGDLILGSDGLPQKVVSVHEQGMKEVWEVKTTQGVVIECCAEHLWAVEGCVYPYTKSILTTEEIFRQGVRVIVGARDRYRFALPNPEPAQYDSGDLPLDPYLLGLLLGDGGMSTAQVLFSNADPVLHREMVPLLPSGASVRYRDDGRCPSSAITFRKGARNPVISALRDMKLFGKKSVDKFIPELYKFSSVEVRLSLLQGLMDTDGECNSRGYMSIFSSSSSRLASDVAELVRSLGGTAKISSRMPKYSGKCHLSYRVSIKLPSSMSPFRHSQAKIDRLNPTRREPRTRIAEVRKTGRFVEMRCISVSNPDSLYRTEGHILTHNTMFLANAAIQARKQGGTPLFITLEMSKEEIEDRLDAIYSEVSYNRLTHGELTPQEAMRLRTAQDELAALGDLFIERPMEGERTVPHIVSRARQLGADYLIIDQLSFMEPVGQHRELTSKHAEIVAGLKKEIARDSAGQIPCLLAVQLNRASLSQPEGVGLNSFANTSVIEQTVDLALGLSRSKDERANRLMRIDILGGRRSEVISWMARWELVNETKIEILGEAQ